MRHPYPNRGEVRDHIANRKAFLLFRSLLPSQGIVTALWSEFQLLLFLPPVMHAEIETFVDLKEQSIGLSRRAFNLGTNLLPFGIAPSFHVRDVALFVSLPPLAGPCRCLRLLLGTQRIGRPPFTHSCSPLNRCLRLLLRTRWMQPAIYAA